jgi:malate synthase
VIRHDVHNDYHGDPHRVQNQARLPQIFPILHHIFIMVAGVEIHTKVAQQAQSEILTDGALEFLAAIHRTFESTRQSLLNARHDAQRRFDSGVPLDFFPETAAVRNEPSWACAPPGPGLEDRRVEITGPPDRKMVINALNSGAKTFMADFEGEDSLA